MKILGLICGFGLMQFGINEAWGAFKQPPAHTSFFMKKEIPVNERWECNRCGHTNSDWTSICGKCGRSK